MATTLVIRNVDEALVRALKERAALHGRSFEEEHREILRKALLEPQKRSLKDMLFQMPDVGNDDDFNVR